MSGHLRAVDEMGLLMSTVTLPILGPAYEEYGHYSLNTGPTDEFGLLPETKPTIKNIGWTLGNDCPYRCSHCYSLNARRKGRDMEQWMVDRIVGELKAHCVETVNLGGNEPLFTNGLDARKSMLPYIIEALVDIGIDVGLTTSGISLLRLHERWPHVARLLNDVDISFDSPFEKEHNKNRGADIYKQAIAALTLCCELRIPHTCIMCGMSWNFRDKHLRRLVELAKHYDAQVRINPMKPVQPEHMSLTLDAEQYYKGFALLHELCEPIDLGEPPIAAVTNYEQARRCPCGRTSFRIHSITPDGAIHVSPCVYLHDYKAPQDLLQHSLGKIIDSAQFRVFRQRNANPESVSGCDGCKLLEQCGGGCAARSFLHGWHMNGIKSFQNRDPYCPEDVRPKESFPQRPRLNTSMRLVHMDYLCTWIGRPY